VPQTLCSAFNKLKCVPYHPDAARRRNLPFVNAPTQDRFGRVKRAFSEVADLNHWEQARWNATDALILPKHALRIVIPCHGFAIPCHGFAIPCHGFAIPCHGFAIPCHGITIPCHRIAIPRRRIVIRDRSIVIRRFPLGFVNGCLTCGRRRTMLRSSSVSASESS